MLSSIEGAAVMSIVIQGVNNEFATIPGVIEDVLHVVLNVKGIVVKNSTGKPGKMSLSIKGEGVVRASDITCDEHLEVINKDHVIANLSDGGSLDIDFFVENGSWVSACTVASRQITAVR